MLNVKLQCLEYQESFSSSSPQIQAFMSCRMHESHGMFLILKEILAVLFFSVNGSGIPTGRWSIAEEFPFLQ